MSFQTCSAKKILGNLNGDFDDPHRSHLPEAFGIFLLVVQDIPDKRCHTDSCTDTADAVHNGAAYLCGSQSRNKPQHKLPSFSVSII